MSALLRTPELEKYELLEEIGHGGMATVYRALDRRLGREVAVKLIHRHLRDNEEAAARFLREAKAIAKLRHPNIVDVYDISAEGESDSYLVVELIRGVTLRQLLKQQKRLEPELAAVVALQVAAALEHAHRHGVVHRDVKPENVLIELPTAVKTEPEQGPARVKVKLTDFGIAKLLDAQGVTSTGQVLGSPAHMAPEQIEGGDVHARTDVFGLGVLLYECMVGNLPFEGAHPAQVLRKVLDGEFVAPDNAEPRVGASYSRIVSRALSRDPLARHASAQELADALSAELARLGFLDVQGILDWVGPSAEYAGFNQRIVPELVRAGLRGRVERRMAQAAEDFNRALAYRPGDAELLRHVSGLRRIHRMRRAAALSALGLVGVAVPIALLTSYLRSAPADSPGTAPVQVATSPTAQPSAAQPSPPVLATAHAPAPKALDPASLRQASGSEEPAVVVPAPGRPRRPPTATPAPVPAGEREVIVRVAGAMGGTLRIDGQPKEWFGGVRHKLSLGTHRFEFVSPDESCCSGSVRNVTIVEGEGPQLVVGDISFREATLKVNVQGNERGVMTCRTLFSGEQRFPGPERRVAMSRLSTEGDCLLRAEGDVAAPLVQKRVTLRAGQPAVIQWP
jgi:eukaryotic-like serine/threonine-protein kinase